MKLDILAIGVHPDDIELCCSGTVIKHIEKGYKVGILDLTQGELGTRGSAKLRLQEAAHAAKIMGVTVRDNLGLRDGFLRNHEEEQMEIVRKIREYQPEIVLANAVRDRHPDHGKAAQIVDVSCFLAGLLKIETVDDQGKRQERWRPKAVYHYIQDYHLQPDLIVDVTAYFEKRMEATLAFRSQFYNPNSKEPDSPISSQEFLDFLEARAREYGRLIGTKYGEGFTVVRPVGIDDLLALQ